MEDPPGTEEFRLFIGVKAQSIRFSGEKQFARASASIDYMQEDKFF
jgi:hypothetical protein